MGARLESRYFPIGRDLDTLLLHVCIDFVTRISSSLLLLLLLLLLEDQCNHIGAIHDANMQPTSPL